jgi:hypothetical protein
VQHRFEIEVNGRGYVVQHFMPTKAIPILVRLANLLGLSFNGSAKKMDSDLMAAIISGVGDLLNRMNEKEVLGLVKDLLSCVYADKETQPVNMDTQFVGRIGDLFEVLTHVVRIQYTDFFERAGQLLTSAVRSAMEKIQEKTRNLGTVESPGSSGG